MFSGLPLTVLPIVNYELKRGLYTFFEASRKSYSKATCMSAVIMTPKNIINIKLDYFTIIQRHAR